jgi:hypothetical protein
MVMIAPLNCLFVENNEDMYRTIKDGIEAYWADFCERPLRFKYFVKVDDAIKELNTSAKNYQIAITDILFPPIDDPTAPPSLHRARGLEVIHAAAKSAATTVIIGLSQGERTKPKLDEEARLSGADLFWFHDQVDTEFVFQNLCRDITGVLYEKGQLHDPLLVESDEGNPSLQYLLSLIGKDTIRNLVRRLVKSRIDQLQVEYLSPGMSGAFPIKIRIFEANSPTRGYLLKISKDRERLLKELTRAPAGEYGNRLIVKYMPPPDGLPVAAKDWYAIASVFEEDAVTLHAWLRGNPSSQRVESVFHALFIDGLVRGYAKQRANSSALRVITGSLSRKARISEALNLLEPVISHRKLGDAQGWPSQEKQVRLFLEGQLGSIPSAALPSQHYKCQCHGDLHTKNILVAGKSSPGPLIIDTAEFDNYHWAADYTRLLADLLLTSYDAGVTSYLWERMPHWLEMAESIIALSPISKTARDGTIGALNWLTKNSQLICLPLAEDLAANQWEFQVALAMEFLRGAYRADVSDPKKVMGILAAYKAIEAAEASVPRRK